MTKVKDNLLWENFFQWITVDTENLLESEMECCTTGKRTNNSNTAPHTVSELSSLVGELALNTLVERSTS